MTKQQANVAAAHRFIGKNGVETAKAVVMQAQDGRFASMVSIISRSGRSTILHLGFGKTEAVAKRFAISNAIGFASI